MNRTKNKNQQLKIDNAIERNSIIKNDFENKTCHRHFKVGISAHGKSYLMNYILPKKRGLFFIITKSPKQYPNIKAQISDENQPLENYENSTVVFDDMLLSKQ